MTKRKGTARGRMKVIKIDNCIECPHAYMIHKNTYICVLTETEFISMGNNVSILDNCPLEEFNKT
jgi:hypothetical protein